MVLLHTAEDTFLMMDLPPPKGLFMFTLNEKVVYPGHGVAKVSQIIEKKIAGSLVKLFELRFINKDMTILVPIHNFSSVGIRPLSTSESIETIFKVLSERVLNMSRESVACNWNKRNKEYQCKLRTGHIKDISEIYRDLKCIAIYKELSFGEKNLLEQTESLLVEEIALVVQLEHDQVLELLRAPFKVAHEVRIPLGPVQSVQHTL